MICLYPPGAAAGAPQVPAEAAGDAASIYDGVVLPGPRGDGLPGVAVNMVTTVDGKATLGAGRIRGPIGSPVDREIMRRLRRTADAVLRGAGTVRANPRYPTVPEQTAAARLHRGLPPQPLAVVLTGSGHLPLDAPFFREAPRRPVVITTAGADPRQVERAAQVADVIVAGDDRLDLRLALRLLAERHGVQRALCEGGPTLNHAFFAAGLVQELFWTVAPKVAGFGGDLTMVHGPALLEPLPRLELLTAWFHEGELFLRYRVAGA